jgi:membrane-bound inhibitor of C-type lysozyme
LIRRAQDDRRQRSACGARDEGEGIEFWNRGTEAMLTLDGEEHACVVQGARRL